MKRILLLCSLALLIVFAGCRKKKFHEISTFDQFGNSTSITDPSDWQIEDERLPRKVRSEMDNMDCSGDQLWPVEQGIRNAAILPYPNPSLDNMHLLFDVFYQIVEVVIVSWSNKIIYSDCFYVETSPIVFALNMKDLGMKEDHYYRVYYRIYGDDKSKAKTGHGDILWMESSKYYEKHQ